MLKRRLLASVTVLTLALAAPASTLGQSAGDDQYRDPFKSQTKSKKKKSTSCPKKKRSETKAQKRKRTKCVAAKKRAAKRRSGGR